jgi:hypothetical protein
MSAETMLMKNSWMDFRFQLELSPPQHGAELEPPADDVCGGPLQSRAVKSGAVVRSMFWEVAQWSRSMAWETNSTSGLVGFPAKKTTRVIFLLNVRFSY